MWPACCDDGPTVVYIALENLPDRSSLKPSLVMNTRKSAPGCGTCARRWSSLLAVTATILVIVPHALAQSVSSGISAVLLDQTDDFDGRFIAFRTLTAPEQDATSADDFTVPEGEIWTIEDIFISGSYLEIPSPHPEGTPTCDSADVGIWSNIGTLPGDALFFYAGVVPTSDSDGDLSLDIDDTVLAAGTYWLSIQCAGNLDIGNGIRGFYWRRNDNALPNTFGNMAVSINPGGGLGFPDTSWVRLQDTSEPPPSLGYDFSFILNGVSETSTSVDNEVEPINIELDTPFPNPFAASTTVGYSVRTPTVARIAVFDVLGREVRLLVEGFVAAGRHEATLHADGLPSGLFFIRMETDNGDARTRLVSLTR